MVDVDKYIIHVEVGAESFVLGSIILRCQCTADVQTEYSLIMNHLSP